MSWVYWITAAYLASLAAVLIFFRGAAILSSEAARRKVQSDRDAA